MTMPEGETFGMERPRCQARPAAARRGFREDKLCASYANTAVSFGGIEMPVCRIHEAAFTRWGSEAEANAATLWAWTTSPQLAPLS
jgi:hypothetical protein